jgi:predicted phage tail protein
VGGAKGTYEFTVKATTSERTLLYYIGGWNTKGKITASLPGARGYVTTFSFSGKYSRVVKLRFRADAPTTMTVRFTLEGGSGSINMQAAALQGTTSTPQPPPTTTGSAQLTWNAPTENTDGSRLVDLQAYKVYWGQTQGQYSHSTRINNLSARNYTISELSSGRWYFAVTAINAVGGESAHSNVASKLIP